MTPAATLDLDSDPAAIIGSRDFDAPRELVFLAFTDPQHLSEWWGPDGFSITTLAFDFKPGGVWRFVMHGPDGRDYQNHVTFDQIAANERIVYRHGRGDDIEPVSFTMTITLEDRGGRTRLTWRNQFASAAERDRVIREYGAGDGLAQTLGRLGVHVADRDRSFAGQEFSITRVFDAPRELVWKAFTDPEHMKQWWGPKGSSIIASRMDLRVDGTYHGAMRDPAGQVMWAKFVYREVAEPERLVWIHSFSDEAGGITRHPLAPHWPLQLLTTVTFEVAPGRRTRLTLRWLPINATAEERAVFDAGRDSMHGGWSGTFDQLAHYLTGL